MHEGDLAEANAIDVRIKRAELDDPAQERDALSIIGPRGFEGHDSADDTFWPDSSVTCVWWNGRMGRWVRVDARTFRTAEPDGKVLTLTLTSDDKYSLWVYSDGKAAYAIRHATAPK